MPSWTARIGRAGRPGETEEAIGDRPVGVARDVGDLVSASSRQPGRCRAARPNAWPQSAQLFTGSQDAIASRAAAAGLPRLGPAEAGAAVHQRPGAAGVLLAGTARPVAVAVVRGEVPAAAVVLGDVHGDVLRAGVRGSSVDDGRFLVQFNVVRLLLWRGSRQLRRTSRRIRAPCLGVCGRWQAGRECGRRRPPGPEAMQRDTPRRYPDPTVHRRHVAGRLAGQLRGAQPLDRRGDHLRRPGRGWTTLISRSPPPPTPTPDWAARPPRERGEVLRKAWQLMIERTEQIAFLMSLEMGKSLTDSRGEVSYAAEFFRWYSEEAVRVGGELRMSPTGANRILTFKKPFGRRAAVDAVELPGRDGHPETRPRARRGLHGGPQAGGGHPASPHWCSPRRSWPRPGVPAGVDQRADVGASPRPLVEARSRRPSGSGSCRSPARPGVGTSAAQAGCRSHGRTRRWNWAATIRFIVLGDADLDAAGRRARCSPRCATAARPARPRTGFSSSESVADEFACQTRRGEDGCADGSAPGTADESTELGPMINARAASMASPTRWHARCRSRGAKAVLGGDRQRRPRAFFFPATVLTGRAPRLGRRDGGDLRPGGTDHLGARRRRRASARELDLRWGLTGYVYTGDLARGLRVCERLEVGMVGSTAGSSPTRRRRSVA